MEVQERVVYAFRGFRLDARERLLTRGGSCVPLPPKAFDLLVVLVRNAGRLVDKDLLLREVWNGVHVEEGNLAKHISMVRKALDDASDGPGCIETVPKTGYRFVAEVSELPVNGTAVPVKVTEPKPPPFPDRDPRPPEPRRPIGKPWLVAGALALSAIAALLVWMLIPAPAPKVVSTDRITRSSRAWWTQHILTDGAHLYFARRTGGIEVLATVSIDGDDPVVIPTPFAGSVKLLDISRDHSRLLLANIDRLPEYEDIANEPAFWTMPITGGSPQRLGALSGNDAAWFPDGRRILFARGSDIYAANGDGSDPRRVSTVNGKPMNFRWSPDGRILRFTVESLSTGEISIWEANADGSHAHSWSASGFPPKPGWMQGESAGIWTPDGKYFIYRSMRDTSAGLWAVREGTGLRGRLNSKSFLLNTFTNGMAYANPLISPDGKRIFFIAEQEDRLLMRYDKPSGRASPYLGGIPARILHFSRDGNWVTYYSYDYRLWRSRVDGSDRVQLTFAPLGAGPARWSPDRTQIVFRASQSLKIYGIYLISAEGGTPRIISPPEFTRVSIPCWAPDGKSVLFGEFPPDPNTPARSPQPMQRVDLESGKVSALSGSEGLNAQDVSPDGKSIVAFAQNDSRLVLFNLSSRQITELAQGKDFYSAFWSHDGRYIYYQDLFAGAEQPIMRVRLSDHKIEPVAGLSQFNPADAMAFSFAGLTPDDSPLASVILNRGDIYALNVDFP